jgi:hypothetical protein
MIDLEPAARRMTGLVVAVAEDRFDAPTPCAGIGLGDLIDHVGSLSLAFDGPRDGSLFGPVVPVAGSAAPLDRLLGLTGRDPRWRPPPP